MIMNSAASTKGSALVGDIEFKKFASNAKIVLTTDKKGHLDAAELQALTGRKKAS